MPDVRYGAVIATLGVGHSRPGPSGWCRPRRSGRGGLAAGTRAWCPSVLLAGLPGPAPSGPPPAIAFLDRTGSTRLTEERDDRAAAELAARLVEIVHDLAHRHGGRPVKLLGDGVMFHFPDPGQGVRCGLALVDRIPRAGLPPARVGLHSGPVVFQDGDYFGRTVNISARISDHARPGQVLVSDQVVADADPLEGVRFEPIGPVPLKGLATPMSLYAATRAD